MRIGIVGGTGGMGKGFALRWSRNHDIVVGSRSAPRAAEAAAAYQDEAVRAYGGIKGSLRGTDNVAAAKDADALVLSIPYENIDSTCPDVLAAAPDSCVVVSPIVPMKKTKAGFEFIPLMDGGGESAHKLVGAHMKDRSLLVSAFHVISDKKMADPGRELDYDIFVAGDDSGAVETVNGLIREIAGLRPIYLGPGSLAYMAEIATPMLLNAMIRNKIKNPGIKIL